MRDDEESYRKYDEKGGGLIIFCLLTVAAIGISLGVSRLPSGCIESILETPSSQPTPATMPYSPPQKYQAETKLFQTTRQAYSPGR